MSSEALPGEAVRPASIDELADVMRAAAADGRTVRARGRGTKWSWGAAAPDPDVVVDLAGLDAVVEHAEGDLVLTVEPGVRLADVQDALAPHRQWLALDPAETDATVGGIVATAASGPHRLRFGTPRDLLIGVTVVLADGTVARSGGKVVKNVAGYDLGKLFCGSYGTLGVVASCTFRLHPTAAARRVVTVATDDPAGTWSALRGTPVVASAVEWDGAHVSVLVESSPAAADAQAGQVAGALGGTVTDTLPTGFGARPWTAGDVAFKLTFALSGLAPVVAALRSELPGARLAAHVGSGVAWAAARLDPGRAAAAVTALRAAVAPYDGSVVVVDAPADVKSRLDVWGPVRGLDVMRRIKDRFDPDGRMSPGVFVGGL